MTLLHYKESESDPCIDDYISRGDIHLVLMFSNQYSQRILTNYAIRRLAVDYGVPLITNVQVTATRVNFVLVVLSCPTNSTAGGLHVC